MNPFTTALNYLSDNPIRARLACLAFLAVFWSAVFAAVATAAPARSIEAVVLNQGLIVKGPGNLLCITDGQIAMCAPMHNYEPGIELSFGKSDPEL